MVLADSHGIPRAPHYSGTDPEPRHRGTAYTTITHYGHPSQGVRLPRQHRTTPRQRGNGPAPQHPMRNGRRLSHAQGLAIIRFRSPLLTEYLFLRVLRCFTSPRSPHHPIHVQMMVAQHNPGRVPPFGHPRIKARSPTPRGISQAATSFISSWCQGIHRMPHKTTQQKTRPTSPPPQQQQQRTTGPPRPPHPHHKPRARETTGGARRQQRCSQPLYKSQTTHHNHQQPPPKREGAPAEEPEPNTTPTQQRKGARVLRVNPTARPPAHSTCKAPMPNPKNEDAPHQKTQQNQHAPKHHTTPTPRPPHQQAEKDTRTGRRDTAPQTQGSLERR